MSDMARKMLDELMGTSRDGAQSADSIKFTDSEVCKSYLLGLCPYDLFHSTGSFKSSKKLDMGVCTQIHDPALKADYELAAQNKDYEYEFEQCQQIAKFVEDCDRKVAANKKRLEETQDQESLGPEAQAVHELNEKIGVKLFEAEELGAAGNVEESMKILTEIEELKADKRKAEDIYRNAVPATQNQQQKLRVCEICAAFLSLYDNDRRLADHFGGRLHMGFIQVRERLVELKKITEEKREKAKERRSERRDRDRDRDRDRERDRRRSDRDRDRDRDRRRRRSRSRSRGRGRRSRSRDRHRERNRSRDRSRERRRDRERSRSSDRKKDRDRSPPPKDKRDNNEATGDIEKTITGNNGDTSKEIIDASSTKDEQLPDESSNSNDVGAEQTEGERDRERDKARDRRRSERDRSRGRGRRSRSRSRSRRRRSRSRSRDRHRERNRSRDRSRERNRSCDRSRERRRDRERSRSSDKKNNRDRSSPKDKSDNNEDNGDIEKMTTENNGDTSKELIDASSTKDEQLPDESSNSNDVGAEQTEVVEPEEMSE